MSVFETITPGIFTTIQDGGFTGFRAYGVQTGGAADCFSLRAANILAGNPQFAAALEITVTGPVLQVVRDTIVAVTGGDLSPMVNETILPMWETVPVARGNIISFKGRKSGCRSYLAVQGGIDAPTVLGAKSTYVRAGFGGMYGRPLQKGDIIKAGSVKVQDFTFLEMPREVRPDYESSTKLRLIPGPHYDIFSKSSRETFWGELFTVTKRMDRMGIVLTGKQIKGPAGEMISQPVTPGTIQIPPAGEPVILMAECQTTGGYPHIGTLISADMHKAAQLFTGDKVSFSETNLEEARNELRCQEEKIRALCPKPIIKQIYQTTRYSYEIIAENPYCLDTKE